MREFRRILSLLIITLLLFAFISPPVSSAYELVPIPRARGNGYVTYRGQQVQVKMPDKPVEKEAEFRAVWVSPLVSDIVSYSSASSYKAQIYEIFEVMEHYNMNALIFHMRIFNDALYKSNLNPVSKYMDRADFDKWDPIAWVIEECHKRGIEFHAWLNPYRVASSTPAQPLAEYAKRFPSYNVASRPEYLLTGTKGVILNPGEPVVRAFLINTCMEIIENYDVDAIHFDDYFYISGIDDSATRQKYNNEGLSADDFRRKQVDLFIEALSQRIRKYNDETGRMVQLGISPTGIYRNGYYSATAQYDENGNLISPYGSNTSGYAHYGSPLYSDTKKWVDNEWIDYIVPQSYWAMEHVSAGYADVIDWWVKALKHKKVNLYLGMGLYMASDSSSASWYTNPREAANQVQYASQYPEVRGHVIFSYNQVRSAYKSGAGRYHSNMENVRSEMWNRPAVLPELRNYAPIYLPAPASLNASKTPVGYRLDFAVVKDAKFYAIYRGSGALDFSSAEIIDIVGDISSGGVISYIDEIDTGKNYVYGVKAISVSNSLGAGISVSTQGADTGSLLDLGQITDIAVPEVAHFHSIIRLRWLALSHTLGGPISYDVYKSTEDGNWELVSGGDYQIEKSGYNYTLQVKLGGESVVNFRIDARNRIGRSSTYFSLLANERFDYLRNFTAVGEIHAGSAMNFVWTKLKGEGITYKVQSSPDGYFWTDITSADNPVVDAGVNCFQPYVLPPGRNQNYYRVIAVTDAGKIVSSPLLLNSYEKIGDFAIKVNGEPYQGPVTVHENDVVRITWDNHRFGDEEVSYQTRISADQKSWMPFKLHNLKNTLTRHGDIWEQTVVTDFRHFTLYVQIEAFTDTGKSYSQVIELRVQMETLDVARLVEYIAKAPERYLYKTDIFRK